MNKYILTDADRGALLNVYRTSVFHFDLEAALPGLTEIPILTRDEGDALPVGTVYVTTIMGRPDVFRIRHRNDAFGRPEDVIVRVGGPKYPPAVVPEVSTRLIGPIPTSYCSPVEGGVFDHPGGPAPRWGGYSPIQVDVPLSWFSPEIQSIVTQPETCWGPEGHSIRSTLFQAHTTDTVLLLTTDGWYVAAPARPCRRAVTIAVDALRDGAAVPGGLLPEETGEALRIHAAGGSTYRARLPWETEPTAYPAAEPVDGEVEVFLRSDDE